MICRRCVMDDQSCRTVFYPDGTCSHCREHYRLNSLRDKLSFHETIGKIRKRRRGRYHAVLGISGGVDSCYVALLAYQNGLNVLLVSWDNGYSTPESEKNVRLIQEYTGYDHTVFYVDPDEFHDIQRAYLKAGVIDIEAPSDHAIRATVYRAAKDAGAKYVLSGSNLATESIYPPGWGYEKGDRKNIEDIHRRHGTLPMRSFQRLGYLGWLWLAFVRGIKQVNLLDYVDYNKFEAKKTLKKTVGWTDYGGKHGENVITRFYQKFILPTRFGVDKRRSHLSDLVCSGHITRAAALRELKNPPYKHSDYVADRKKVLRALGMSEDRFDLYMNSPVRQHSDYKTDKKILSFLRKARQILRFLHLLQQAR